MISPIESINVASRHSIVALVAASITGLIAALPGGPAFADSSSPMFPMEIKAANAKGGVNYVISIRNTADIPANLLVVQRFVGHPSGLSASNEARVDGGAAAWSLQIPPKELGRVSSKASFASGASTMTTVCLANPVNLQVVDCAAGELARPGFSARLPSPLWTVLIGFVLIGSGLAYVFSMAAGSRSHWWPALRAWLWPRREKLAVAGSAVAVLAIFVGGFLIVAGQAQPFLARQAGASAADVGWAGDVHTLAIGRPTASRQAEFTLYQWSCAKQPEAAAQCTATVAVRNVTGASVVWAARMQRLVDRDGHWLTPDPGSTAAANGGADPFATPLNAGERRFASIVFRPKDLGTLTRLELREGAFAAGVSLNLK